MQATAPEHEHDVYVFPNKFAVTLLNPVSEKLSCIADGGH